MNRIRSLVTDYSLIIFFCLAYALSWWPSLIEAHDIFPAGPLLAALIIIALTERWIGVRTFLSRIVQWRVSVRWYVLVLGLPVLVNSVAIGLNMLLGAQLLPIHAPAANDLLSTFFSVLILIGLGEEPAWRGFALPRLRAGRSALLGGLLLGMLHALWHLPLFGLEYDLHNGLPWLIGLLSYSIVTTWLYQRTNGNLLLPVLFHTSVNTTAHYLFNPLFSGTDLISLWWLWGVLWAVVAITCVLMAGPQFVGKRVVARMEATKQSASTSSTA